MEIELGTSGTEVCALTGCADPLLGLYKNKSAFFVRIFTLPILLKGLISCVPGGGVLRGMLGGAVPLGSPNPDPLSDRKMSFFTTVFKSIPVFRPASEKLCHHSLD